MIRALLPHPLLTLGLFATWLLLSGSVSAGDVLVAIMAALAIPQVMRRLEPDRSGVRSPGTVMRLASYVAVDVLRSNYAVGTIILGRRKRERVSGFIHVPLDLRNRYGLAVLAIIVTSTPGTLWVQYDRLSGRLLLHVLDLVEEQDWIDLIKGRYERLLMDIFP
ncbi:Na+/H+ antiporter subunit E [Brevundimonas pondensis]|uniref:Na+/H+ antiporter subunit E n=1 Tax=Brevundimonas pondensis TaxID=2774189 RepID=UPI001A9E92EB|nr:Na+/H+ antiporter subunit E [Brevundimonas pondensis]